MGYKLVQYESLDDDRLKGQANNLYNQIAVLIQVYYDNELTKNNSINYVTPADMIYELDKNRFAHLYLKPNNSYTVIYRDRNNKIIYKDNFIFSN